ncbi:MAG: hypothetical protein FWE47_01165 [Oscillospiraceae bacterium]|nr:hypothetical protein [Oscillospiraceae bacterium]
MNSIFRDNINEKSISDKTKQRRETFTSEVREIYQNIANSPNQNHFHQTTSGITPQGYYGSLQHAVIHEISQGKFDSCRDGMEIVNKVAKDKTQLTKWKETK